MSITISNKLFSRIYRLAERISEEGVVEKDAYLVSIHKERLDKLLSDLASLAEAPLKQRCLTCSEEWETEKSVCPICGGRLTPFIFAGR